MFNLIPVWQLDGSRGFHALSQAERGIVVVAVGVAIWATGVGMLWFIGIVGLYRAGWGESGPGHTPTLATFILLVFALSWLARGVV
jgi:Zn-dependent protease